MQNAEKIIEVANAINRYKVIKRSNSLYFYKPYTKQISFHSAGLHYSERCFGAGNQLGKTFSGAQEAAYHATGLYPDWWKGARFTQKNVGWVTGESGELIRDTVQKLLCGRVQVDEDIGTGSIPKDKIIQIVKAHGVKDLLDHVKVRHVDGGTSIIFFKSREKGRAKLQGETIDWVWHDEEPDQDIYTECLTRTNKGQNGQFSFMTFTPLKGMTQVVEKFYKSPSSHQSLTMMTIDDVEHYSKEEKEKIINSYPAHEREARAKGIPILGSGRVFPVSEELIKVDPFRIPHHWVQIKGMDFGWDHPETCAWCAYDRDSDCFYVYNGFSVREQTITQNSLIVNKLKPWMPVAWPHDGLKHDKQAGKTIAELYMDESVNMLEERATFEDGGNSVEAGLKDMYDRMITGRFKVFSTCEPFWEEFRLYHRKDGKIVKERDDFIDAVRYALMMKRFAITEPMQYDYYEDEQPSVDW